MTITTFFPRLLFCLFLASPLLAKEQVPLIPREILFGNPQRVTPKLSADGTKIAYLAPDARDVLNIFVQDMDKGTTRQVTAEKERGIRSYFWQYTNQHLLYLQDSDGNENWHLYQTDITTGLTRDLTPDKNARAEVITYSHRCPNELLIAWNSRDPKAFDVWKINLVTGSIDLEVKNPGNVRKYVADQALCIRGMEVLLEGGTVSIQVCEQDQELWHEILNCPSEDSASLVCFSEDATSAIVLTSVNADTERLLSIHTATGQTSLIAQDPQYDLHYVLLHPTTHSIQAVRLQREKPEWIVIDPTIQADFEALGDGGEKPFGLVSRNLSDTLWIISVLSDTQSVKYFLYDRKTHRKEFLFSSQPDLNRYPLSEMLPVSFQARDGMTLYGYLSLPVGQGPKNLPTILFVHGGPWARDNWGMNPTVQWLTNRGYTVLQLNFRGSTGYGKKYLNAGNKEWSKKMQDDLIDAKRWLVANEYSHPELVGIYGGSYGGYAALVGLTATPEEFCCGVDFVGPSNLVTLIESIPPYWTTLKDLFNTRVGNVETEREFLKQCSPMFYADRITKPLFIAQGANDPRVKKEQSDLMVDAIRQNGQQVTYLLYPDEGHGFTKPKNRKIFYAAVESFLANYMKGRLESAQEDESWKHLLR